MQKAVNNLTEAQVILGGVEVSSKGQRVVRESLITEDEKKAIADSGAVVNYGNKSITVSIKSDKDEQAEADALAKAKADEEAEAKAKAGADANKDTETKDVEKFTHLDVAYPAELIKKDGGVNGSAKFKADVKTLQDKFGETILDDNAFMAKYPEADIEVYRVKVGIDE